MRNTLVSNEVLGKATRLFAERGYEATSLQDVADAVGISRPALYHYVSGKEDLLVALVEQAQPLVHEASRVRHDATLGPTEKLRRLTNLLVRQRAEAPERFRILDRSETMLPDGVRNDYRQHRLTLLRQVKVIIDEGIASGQFKPVDVEVAAFSVVGMCNWMAWWFPEPGRDVDAVAHQITEFAVDMLAADGDEHDRRGGKDALLQKIRTDLNSLERLLDDPQ